MKTAFLPRRWIIAACLCLGMLPSAFSAAPLPAGRPGALGFSPERLEKLHAMVQEHIDAEKHAGAISMIVRHGKIADWRAYGYRDLETKAPMERNTIVRIYSMSKIITSVAVLMLHEEGRFRLDQPIGDFIPELKKMKVFAGGTADAPVLVDAKSPITIKQLLTHTAGFTYDSTNNPVEQLNGRADLWNAPNFKEFMTRVSQLPLAHQPGEAFLYGINTDVLGYLVEVVSGQKFEDFLQQRIFAPLKMTDTAFYVPETKTARMAKIYELGPDGKLRPAKAILNSYHGPGQGFPSGGGGLYSTIDDYARFGQMLLNGGCLDGQQILGRKTVELMTVNHLNHLARQTHIWSESDGFGLGGSVRLDLAKGNSLGSIGQFGWSGAATTYFNLDPKEKTLALLFVQHFPHNQHGIFGKFSTLFYQSLVE
jgi:CubicO group peptidase (beta-lactamase class C family)